MVRIMNENIEELDHDFVCMLLDNQGNSKNYNDNLRVVVVVVVVRVMMNDDDDDDDVGEDDVVYERMAMMMGHTNSQWLNEHWINLNLVMMLLSQREEMNVLMLILV